MCENTALSCGVFGVASFINTFWSEMGDSNSRPDGPKPMSEPSGRTESHSLALSVAPAVPF